MIDKKSKKHYIAIIGGSIAGSEAAFILAEKGYRVVVFEMNDLPYGKIEDGLPKWHVNLRNKQEQNIDNKLDHPNIRFVPNVKIGTTLSFDDLVNHWGFTVIILANGAWKDRFLPVNEVDKFVNNGLVYQNALLHWYNHKHEPNYKGNTYEIKDGTVVIGGGLSSLDVMKLGMIELVQKALLKIKRIKIDLFTLEKKGILKVLNENNVNLEDLKLKGMTLVYRRNMEDMPLKSPIDNTKENILKAKAVSKKLLQKYADNFLFQFIPLSSPFKKVEENGKLKAITFYKNKIIDGNLVPLKKETFVLQTPLLISSIGSFPEKINGLPYDNATLTMKSESNYCVQGFTNVFAIGNAVTGRGNIRESKKHGELMTNKIIDDHIETDDIFENWLIHYNENLKEKIKEQLAEIELEIKSKKIMPDHIIQGILERSKDLQEKVGFKTYKRWINLKTPIRLEDILSK